MILCCWFLFGSTAVDPVVQNYLDQQDETLAIIDADQISTLPRREMMTEPLATMGAFKYKCSKCHGLRVSPEEAPLNRLAHKDQHLDHGLNDQCYNCHDRENRDLLNLHGTRKVTYAESELLCSKCHGPTYRDWQQGMHGKTTGSWRKSFNEKTGNMEFTRLKCAQCHDPHHPAFTNYTPLPKPDTLRLPDDSGESHGTHVVPEEDRDPLRNYDTTLHTSTEKTHQSEDTDDQGSEDQNDAQGGH